MTALALSISTMNATTQNEVCLSVSPQQAVNNLSLEQELFDRQGSTQKSNNKRKRGNAPLASAGIEPTLIDENEVSKKLSRDFMLLRDIKENERLKGELDQIMSSLQLYEEYKKQSKSSKHKTKKSKELLAVN